MHKKQNTEIFKPQSGFHLVEIILGVTVLALIGGLITWRVYTSQQASVTKQSDNAQTAQLNGELSPEQSLEQVAEQGSNESTLSTAEQSAGTRAQSSNGSISGPAQQNTAAQPSTPPTETPPPASNITRPTGDFCQQQNGANFDMWLTENGSYTYQVWENGGWASKTKTGTPARNYDTMQIAEVVPYLTKPKWGHCSDKSGYVMIYYTPSGSAYTYNHLVEFGHVSRTQP